MTSLPVNNPDNEYAEFLLRSAIYLGEAYLDEVFTTEPIALLSLIQRERGDIPGYIESTEAFSQSLEIESHPFALRDRQYQYHNYVDLALAATDIGDFDEAERIFQSLDQVSIQHDQISIQQDFSQPDLHTRAMLARAFFYISTEQYDQAITHINSALSDTTDISERGAYKSKVLHSILAVAYLHNGETAKAMNAINKARESVEDVASIEVDPDLHLPLAILAFDTKDYQKSRTYLDLMLPFSDVSIEWLLGHRDTARLYSFSGIVNQLIGKSESAIGDFETSLDTISALSRYTLYYGSEAQKASYMNTLSRVLNPIVSFQLDHSNTRIDQLAFSALLESKGRILDFFSSSYAVLRQQSDSEAQAILENIENLRGQLSNLAFSTTSELYSEQSLLEMAQLQSQLEELEHQASRKVSRIDESLTVANPISIAEKIPDGSTLIEFLIYNPVTEDAQFSRMFGKPHYAAYVLQPNGAITSIDLGPVAEIDLLVKDLQRKIRSSSFSTDEVKEAARVLDSRLMRPIRQRLGDSKHLLLSPDGALNLIPFETLVDEGGEYLVENYTLTYLTSGRDLIRLQDGSTAQTEPVLIANPTFEQPGGLGTAQRYANLREQKWPPLLGTAQEADKIAAQFSSVSVRNLQGADATEAALKQVNRPSFLHIATHGFFESTDTAAAAPTENPLLRSGLVLSGVNVSQSGTQEDGVVSALEVSSLNLLGTQLVVLSACETGLGDLSVGEGVYGLRRALVLAGSQSQLISLWRVQDDTTRDLMVDYYEHLLSGVGRSEALRKTQLAMLEDEATAHPYYWAAFINSGNWLPLSER